MSVFKKATKTGTKVRMALVGSSGSGKTYTSIALACALADGVGRVAVIDTERGSASKYASDFDFDVLELDSFHPENYIKAMSDAAANGYAAVVIDSLSHAWMGKDGALELVDKAKARSNAGNSFAAWRDVTPLHNDLIDAMLRSPCHVIVTMRSKTEYVLEKDEKTGKSVPRKIGMQPVQRDGMEYEFDIVGDMDAENRLVITKSRCSAISGGVFPKPGRRFADKIKEWLSDATPVEVKQTPAPDAPPINGASPKVALMGELAKWLNLPTDDPAFRPQVAEVIAWAGHDGKITDAQAAALVAKVRKFIADGVSPEQAMKAVPA